MGFSSVWQTGNSVGRRHDCRVDGFFRRVVSSGIPECGYGWKSPLPFPFMAGFHGTGCRKPDGTEPHISSESIPFFGSEISQRYRFNSGNHSGRPFRYSISFQKFCGPVFHSYMPGRSGPDEKFPHAGKKAPACGLPVLPDILCSPSRFAVMSDRKPCSGW